MNFTLAILSELMLLPSDYLKNLTNILKRQAPHARVDRKNLRKNIESLFYSTGVTFGEDESFSDFQDTVKERPSEKEQVKTFRKIASAKDPLSRKVCLLRELITLNARAKIDWAPRLKQNPLNRPHPLIDVSWDMLSTWEQESVLPP